MDLAGMIEALSDPAAYPRSHPVDAVEKISAGTARHLDRLYAPHNEAGRIERARPGRCTRSCRTWRPSRRGATWRRAWPAGQAVARGGAGDLAGGG